MAWWTAARRSGRWPQLFPEAVPTTAAARSAGGRSINGDAGANTRGELDPQQRTPTLTLTLPLPCVYAVTGAWTPVPTPAGTLTFTPSSTPTPTPYLLAGDIAFSGYCSNSNNDFSFVVLKPVIPGTQIFFTNDGWDGISAFYAGGHKLTFTAQESLGVGSQVKIGSNGAVDASNNVAGSVQGSLSFSKTGDQVLAYVGPTSAPSFLAALNMDPAGWQPAGTQTSASSALPAGLDASDSIDLKPTGGNENAAYNCSTPLGSQAVGTMRALLTDSSQWSLNSLGGGSFDLAWPPCASDRRQQRRRRGAQQAHDRPQPAEGRPGRHFGLAPPRRGQPMVGLQPLRQAGRHPAVRRGQRPPTGTPAASPRASTTSTAG